MRPSNLYFVSAFFASFHYVTAKWFFIALANITRPPKACVTSMYLNEVDSAVGMWRFLVWCVGFAECNERGWDHWQAGSAFTASAQLVHPGDVCDQRRWTLWGPRLAGQPAEEPEVGRIRGHDLPPCMHWGHAVCMMLERASASFCLDRIHLNCVRVCVYMNTIYVGMSAVIVSWLALHVATRCL